MKSPSRRSRALKSGRSKELYVQQQLGGKWTIEARDTVFADSGREALAAIQKYISAGYRAPRGRIIRVLQDQIDKERGNKPKPNQTTVNGPGGRVTVKPRGKSASTKESVRIERQGGDDFVFRFMGGSRRKTVQGVQSALDLVRRLTSQGFTFNRDDLHTLGVYARLPSHGGGIRRGKLKRRVIRKGSLRPRRPRGV